jgi:hypothetical protein
MGRSYSDDDVVRWDKSYRPAIDLHLEKLGTDLPQQKVDFHLSNLSGSYYMQGMTLIAQGAFDEAIRAFRDSAEARCRMYERFEKGQGRSLEAGHFQSVLVAFVTKDQALISRLVGHYRADEGTPDSIFLGKALKPVATGDIDAAKKVLAQRMPRIEPQFVGYADSMEAIANRDQQRFVSALDAASESWAKWASKKVKGLPDSVCFIQGVGLVRLAESVLGTPIFVTNQHMPQELLR